MPPFHGRALIVHQQQFLDGERCNNGLQRRSAHDSPGRCGLISSLALAACASTDAPEGDDAAAGSGGGKEVTLSLVAYSTPQAAYEKIIAAFQKTDAGKNVKFTQSYGASGDQSRAVEAGLPADFVMFSLETDMTRLVDAGIVDAAWNTDEYKGNITNSVVALVTRKGNPEGIKDWPDLLKKDIEVITPNPFSSGGARWNIMAAYGAQLDAGKTEAEAEQYLADMLANVPGPGRQRPGGAADLHRRQG